jgi:hypothetical protein
MPFAQERRPDVRAGGGPKFPVALSQVISACTDSRCSPLVPPESHPRTRALSRDFPTNEMRCPPDRLPGRSGSIMTRPILPATRDLGSMQLVVVGRGHARPVPCANAVVTTALISVVNRRRERDIRGHEGSSAGGRARWPRHCSAPHTERRSSAAGGRPGSATLGMNLE